MRILVLCDNGIKRSRVLAHQLKFLNHDVLSMGLDNTHSRDTLIMLMNWADKVILTDFSQFRKVGEEKRLGARGLLSKTILWDIGPDNYPEKFHPELLAKVKQLIKSNPL